MTRSKVQLSLMKNESSRKACLKKRKTGLINKIHELSILSGIQCCLIIFSPQHAEPDVWPSTLGVQEVITKYRAMSEFEKARNMKDQYSFSMQELAKAKNLLKKTQKENRVKEFTIFKNNMSKGGWVLSLNDDDLTHTYEAVLNPQLEEMEERRSGSHFFNQTPGA